jgi:integrase
VTELEPAAAPIVIRPDTTPPVAYTDLDYSITAATAASLLEAQPANTRLAYDRAWGQFETWCSARGRVELPATAQTLADYVNWLTGISLAPATIDQAIGAIRSRHRQARYNDQPETQESLMLLRKYRREWADAGNRTRKKTPVLLDALRRMTDTCDPATPAGARDRAVLLLGFNMMARRSEMAGLDLADLADAGQEGLLVFIKRSKTDQAAQGVEVPVPFGQHTETCAVRAVRAWTQILAEHGITQGAVFRPVDRHGRIGDEPKAAAVARPRLTGKAVSDIVRRRALRGALPDPAAYSCHSLRSGAATTAYAAGVPVSAIAAHGRWSERSPVVLGYIRAVDKWRNNPMKGIGL